MGAGLSAARANCRNWDISLTTGYQRTEAAKASVMTILEIPFAYLMQYIFFDDNLSPLGMLGAGLEK